MAALAIARLKAYARRPGVLSLRILAPALAIVIVAIVEQSVLVHAKWRNDKRDATGVLPVLIPPCRVVYENTESVKRVGEPDGGCAAIAFAPSKDPQADHAMRWLARRNNLTFGKDVRAYESHEALAASMLAQPGGASVAVLFGEPYAPGEAMPYEVFYNDTAVRYLHGTDDGSLLKQFGDEILNAYGVSSSLGAIVRALDDAAVAAAHGAELEDASLAQPPPVSLAPLLQSGAAATAATKEDKAPAIAPTMLAPLLSGGFCISMAFTASLIAEEARLGLTSTLRRTGASGAAMLLGNAIPFAVIGVLTALATAAVGAASMLKAFTATSPIVSILLFTLADWAHSAVAIAFAAVCGRSTLSAGLFGVAVMMIAILTGFIVGSTADIENGLYASSYDVAFTTGDGAIAIAALFPPWQVLRGLQTVQERTLYNGFT